MIYTVGHSTLEEDKFIDMISGHLDTIIDIRSHPTSRWEQFRKENLENWLPKQDINYELDLRLGGWREKHIELTDKFKKFGVNIPGYSKGKFPKQIISKEIKENKTKPLSDDWLSMPDKEAAKKTPSWYNQGLWDYQWFMTLPEFIEGANDLIKRSKKENIGIMCCECLWWKCHRSMVSDFLTYKGVESIHLQPKCTKHSSVISNRLERYHPLVKEIWDNA